MRQQQPDPELLFKDKALKRLVSNFKVKSVTPVKKHILSHQHLYATFYELDLKAELKHKPILKVKRSDLNHFGLPQLITKYLNKSVS
ncbi:MAG: hypothetical protein IPL10_06000 [Bacteroidetes bacterium]|nr:hypothetical protein [Bacteroidota bacterium]